MLTIKTLRAALASAAALAWLPSHAALQARSLDADPATIEAYYDTLLNITWLADASYARLSTPDPFGRLNFDDAQSWAQALDIGGITGWRMPTVDTSCPNASYDCSSPAGELGFMFYVNLGGQATQKISGVHNANYDLFHNIKDFSYWSNKVNSTTFAYVVNYFGGLQSYTYRSTLQGAWAVHDGDIAPVPEPQTWMLMLAGVAVLVFRGAAMCQRARR